jgi:hypothetical protein
MCSIFEHSIDEGSRNFPRSTSAVNNLRNLRYQPMQVLLLRGKKKAIRRGGAGFVAMGFSTAFNLRRPRNFYVSICSARPDSVS